MAILTAEQWITATNAGTLTDGEKSALRMLVSSVCDAIVQFLKPFHPEPITISNCVLDAVPSRDLILPVRPVRAVSAVYYNPAANGVVANFTSDYLLDSDGTDYQLLIDDPIAGISRGGALRRIGTIWGYERVTLPDRLAPTLGAERGSIMVNFTAGPTSVPPSVEYAAVLMTSLLWNRKQTGIPAQSESWNGESWSGSSAFTVSAALHSPDVMGHLSQFAPGIRIA